MSTNASKNNSFGKIVALAHGDKGGVGKSVEAALMVDYALSQDVPVVLIEGDTKVGDVGRRYAETPGVEVLRIDLDLSGIDAAASINELFSEIEKAGRDLVVINTPAGVGKALDASADLIGWAAGELGYELRVAWMVGPDADSARISGESQLVASAGRKLAVVNRGLAPGAGSEHFEWYADDSQPRKAWLASGGLEGELPHLLSRVWTEVRDAEGTFEALVQPSSTGLNVISRGGLYRWLQEARASAVAPLFD